MEYKIDELGYNVNSETWLFGSDKSDDLMSFGLLEFL